MQTSPLYVLDTHTLVWHFEASRKLSPAASRVIDGIENGLAFGIVPTVVLAELMHLSERRKTPVAFGDMVKRLLDSNCYEIVPLDMNIILRMASLQNLELYDRVITATAQYFEATLVTKDQALRDSGIVPCIW